MIKQIFKIKEKIAGFTLVEVLVAMTVFLLVMTAIINIYITTLRSERVAYALLNNESSVRSALEFISRDIRMGKNFSLVVVEEGIQCLNLTTYASGAGGEKVKYCFSSSDNAITRGPQNSPDQQERITPINIKITNGSFQLVFNPQPFITINFTAQVKVRDINYLIPITTSVTPRYLEF